MGEIIRKRNKRVPRRNFHEKATLPQLSSFHRTRSFIMFSKYPAAIPCPKPDESNRQPSFFFPKIHFNVIFTSKTRLFDWSLPFMCSNQNVRIYLCVLLDLPISVYFTVIIIIISGYEYKFWRSALLNFLQAPTTASILDPNILIKTLFSHTLNFCSSPNVRDQFTHLYKIFTKIEFLLTNIFKFRT
jgi:hypothetical protein